MAEGQRVSIEELLVAAQKVNANSIWIHDELFDKEKTLQLHKDFLSVISKTEGNKYQLFGIPQADNVDDWLDCYAKIIQMPEISGIVLSKYSIPESFSKVTGRTDLMSNRIFCLETLKHRTLLDNSKYYHLGGSNPQILREIDRVKRNFPFVQSLDSNIAVKLGIHYMTVEERKKEPTKRLDFNINSLTEVQKEMILHNIKKVLQVRK